MNKLDTKHLAVLRQQPVSPACNPYLQCVPSEKSHVSFRIILGKRSISCKTRLHIFNTDNWQCITFALAAIFPLSPKRSTVSTRRRDSRYTQCIPVTRTLYLGYVFLPTCYPIQRETFHSASEKPLQSQSPQSYAACQGQPHRKKYIFVILRRILPMLQC